MSSDEPPSAPVSPPPAIGSLSPDRNWYWTGSEWSAALSPDARWRWNGGAWEPAAAWPKWARPYESPRARATFVIGSLAAFGVGLVVASSGDLLALGLGSSNQAAAIVQGAGGLVYAIAYVLCVVAFCLWIHRLSRNLPALGTIVPRFSPGWAVGWFFVPFLNLVRPYQVVREIWQASVRPSLPWTLVKWWWALWLISNYLDNLVLRANLRGISSDGLDLASNVVDGVSAALAILLVRRLTAAQDQLAAEPAAGSIQAWSP